MKPAKFLLPGLFLFVLGLGNITVGVFKSAQYDEVIQGLESTEPTPLLSNASALRRIQLAKMSADRLYLRQSTALARKDFYTLVEFGGKAFLALSLPFLLAGILISGFSGATRGGEKSAVVKDPKHSTAKGIQ